MALTELFFTDDFSVATQQDITLRAGKDWTQFKVGTTRPIRTSGDTSNAFVQVLASDGSGTDSFCYGGAPSSHPDVKLTGKIQRTGSGASGTAYFFLRHNSGTSANYNAFYVYLGATLGSNTLSVGCGYVVNGTATAIGTAVNYPVSAGTDYTVDITLIGQVVDIKINGVSVHGGTGAGGPTAAGKIGLGFACVETSTTGVFTRGPINAYTEAAGDVAPTVTTNPQNQTVTAGGTATFTAAFSGSPTPTAQWQRNSVDIPGAVGLSYTTPATSVTGGSANNGDLYRCVATNSAGSITTNAATLAVNAGSDVTPPTLTGAITVSSITQTSYTLSWPAGSDTVAVAGYDYSVNGGTTYTQLGAVLSTAVTGRTPGATDQVRVRARDAAGNLSTPVLSTTVTLSAVAQGTLTLPVLKNNTGFVLADEAGVTAYIYALSGPLVVTKTGQSSNSSGIVVLSDASAVAGTTYRVVIVLSSGAEGMDKVTAT